MRPKKTLIEAAEKDGSMARLNQLLSASQILLCEANNLVEEASDLMKERGLMREQSSNYIHDLCNLQMLISRNFPHW